MRRLAPIGGKTSAFGILTSPAHKGIPAGVLEGMPWAADNGAFTQAFNPDKFFGWIKTLEPHKDTCLFIVCPDALGDAIATAELYRQYRQMLDGWPVAFVAQDGQESQPYSDGFTTLFIGGSTTWKDGAGALDCIRWGMENGKHIHIGRVNQWKRFSKFASIKGSEDWTYDGTKQRFIGKERAEKHYTDLEERAKRQIYFDLFGGDHPG